MQPARLEVVDLHEADYDVAYRLQKEFVDEKKRNPDSEDRLILVEHPEVYTYGRKSPQTPDETVKNFRFIERGGEVTYHNLGQLVAYPILRLSDEERDVHLHLRRLEETVIDVLRDFDLIGTRREKATGVWVDGNTRKIASIGVAVNSWVTYHGVALNVSNDLSGFTKINPCGFPSSVMTSMAKELGFNVEMRQVKERFLVHFARQFHRKLK